MYSAIARNKRNTVFIIILFLAIIFGLGYLDAVIYNNISIVIFTVVIASAYAFFQYFYAAKQAVSMSGGVRIERKDQQPRLWRVVENLAITEGLPMPEIYVISDPSPNAFATGRDPEHAVVAATTGLLDLLTDAELEGVMAHEMGHVKNYDIRVSMIVFGLVVAIGFIADIFLRMAFFGGGRSNNNSGGGGNPVVLILGLAAMLIAPLVASMVQMAISRQREYLADATGSMTTRNPEALASALEKLGTYGRPMQKQNSSMSHLWISDPLKPGLMSRMFSTHPPIADRVARLRSIGTHF